MLSTTSAYIPAHSGKVFTVFSKSKTTDAYWLVITERFCIDCNTNIVFTNDRGLRTKVNKRMKINAYY